MTYDPSNDKAVKNRKRRERRARERAVADLKWVMSEKAGRRFVMAILNSCRMDETSFTVANGLTLAFNEGVRFVGSALKKNLQANCLEEFHLAQSEALAFEKHEAELEPALEHIPEEEDNDG